MKACALVAAALAALAARATASPTPAVDAAATASTTTTSSSSRYCSAYNLPSGGVVILPGNQAITLTAAAAYRPPCQPTRVPAIIAGAGVTTGAKANSTSNSTGTTSGYDTTGITTDETANSSPQFSDFRDPFYASTFPQCYALAATTVISYTLVIMLLITPRSFLDGGSVVLGRRGFTNGGTGGKNIGGRPWLQKVAALTVAISLTIATADTFRVAKNQYSWGIQNAKELQDEVLGGTELKVIHIISDTFLWLAQAQTLIRLFPRQREKVIIKWTAFSLVILDIIFDSLNSFLYSSSGRSFTDAVPALSYLFQLALGVLYAAWVIYYSLMKKRYAYYHPKMRNICLVAFLSLLAILVPVVFFVLDISKPDFTGWGDYVRWVGAAAASVIVWEWVERIEALEREEKKDGILGREVFDGDEMLDIIPSDFSWRRRRNRDQGDGTHGKGSTVGRKGGKGDGNAAERGETNHGALPLTGRSHMTPWSRIAAAFTPQLWLARSGGKGSKQHPGALATQVPADGAHSRCSSHSNIETDAGTEAVGDGEREGEGGGDTEAETDAYSGRTSSSTAPRRAQPAPPLWPARPPPAVTPISRTDTASADSTVYVLRYHPAPGSSTSHTSEPRPTSASTGVAAGVMHAPQSTTAAAAPPMSRSNSSSTASSRQRRSLGTAVSFADSQSMVGGSGDHNTSVALSLPPGEAKPTSLSSKRLWALVPSLPFRRTPVTQKTREDDGVGMSSLGRSSSSHRQTPDEEIQLQREETNWWDIRGRLEVFAATQAEKLREKIRPTIDTSDLPVMVIPAPERRGAALAQVLEEEESHYQQQQQHQQQQQTWPSVAQWNGNSSASASAVASWPPTADGNGYGHGYASSSSQGHMSGNNMNSPSLGRSPSDGFVPSPPPLPQSPSVRPAFDSGPTLSHDEPPAVVAAALSRASSRRHGETPQPWRRSQGSIGPDFSA